MPEKCGRSRIGIRGPSVFRDTACSKQSADIQRRIFRPSQQSTNQTPREWFKAISRKFVDSSAMVKSSRKSQSVNEWSAHLSGTVRENPSSMSIKARISLLASSKCIDSSIEFGVTLQVLEVKRR